MKGDEFCDRVAHLPRLPDREEAILDAVERGLALNWGYSTLDLGDRKLLVANDYVAIGETAADAVRVPCSGPLALRVCERLGMRLPTAEEVFAIYSRADVKLAYVAHGPPYDASMLSVERFEWHNDQVNAGLVKLGKLGQQLLVAGHKKDVVAPGVRLARDDDYCVRHHQGQAGVTEVLAFYGAFDPRGQPLQRDDGAHEPGYADYLHGVRPVSDA